MKIETEMSVPVIPGLFQLLGPVVMGINTTTSALLYKHAFMGKWLEW